MVDISESSKCLYNTLELIVNHTNSVMFGSFNQELVVVYTLSSAQDFFTSHEHIVGIGPFRVKRIRHSVKWSYSQRVFVQNVKVSVVFGLRQYIH